jgi:hypothetical protein
MTYAPPPSSAGHPAGFGGDPADASGDPGAPGGRLPRHGFLGTDGRLRRCRTPLPVPGTSVCRKCGRSIELVVGTNATSSIGSYWRHRPRLRRPSGLVR